MPGVRRGAVAQSCGTGMVWQQIISERGPKLLLANGWTGGTDAVVLTFLRGLGQRADPIRGEIHERLPREHAGVYPRAH